MIQKQRPVPREFPFNRKPINCIAVVTVLALFTLSTSGTFAVAQKSKRRPRQTQSSQTPKSGPTPAPTPPRSLLDMMGEPPPPPPPRVKAEPEVNPGEVIKVETTEVMLPVTVRDSAGRFISNLSRDDFRVFEDNSEQPLRELALKQVPVDVVLMIDASSSAARNLDDFRRAAEGFAAKLGADDRLSLMKFDDKVQLLQDWTASRYQLRRALTRIEPGMFTRFNDALLLAAREQYSDTTQSRRALIVLTDGIDSGRGTTLERALSALLEAQVGVYVVSNTEISRAAKQAELDSLNSAPDSARRMNKLQIDGLVLELEALDQSENLLEQLTAATGGRLYKPRSFSDLESTYAEVAEELRHQYALYYTPLNRKRDGTFRRVRVETLNQNYQPHSRLGYFAPRR